MLNTTNIMEQKIEIGDYYTQKYGICNDFVDLQWIYTFYATN